MKRYVAAAFIAGAVLFDVFVSGGLLAGNPMPELRQIVGALLSTTVIGGLSGVALLLVAKADR
jgi:hypothetical protein